MLLSLVVVSLVFFSIPFVFAFLKHVSYILLFVFFRGMLEDDFNRKKAAIRQAVKEENQ